MLRQALLTWGLSFHPVLGGYPKHLRHSGQVEPSHPCHPVPPTCTQPKNHVIKNKEETLLNYGHASNFSTRVFGRCWTAAQSRHFQDQTGTSSHQFQFISHVSLTFHSATL